MSLFGCGSEIISFNGHMVQSYVPASKPESKKMGNTTEAKVRRESDRIPK
jgi:hypothetical protein